MVRHSYPLFVVLKHVCMIKSQFPHHLLSYVRSERNNLPQDTTEDMQFFQPPCLLQPPAYLLSDFFQPHLPIYCHPLPFRTGESFIDCSKRILKCALLHNTNKYASIPIGNSTTLKERYEPKKQVLECINYNHYN